MIFGLVERNRFNGKMFFRYGVPSFGVTSLSKPIYIATKVLYFSHPDTSLNYMNRTVK